MLSKTDNPFVYKMQVRDKACTICIYVDELEDSEFCTECAVNENRPNWENAYADDKG